MKKILCRLGIHTGKEHTFDVITGLNRWGIKGTAIVQQFECCGRVYIKRWMGET